MEWKEGREQGIEKRNKDKSLCCVFSSRRLKIRVCVLGKFECGLEKEKDSKGKQ